MTEERPLKISINALGGQGGGVLADWIVATAERGGFIAQATSVPGVAQRTGATVYYIELFPETDATKKAPVLALMPVPGDVDVVIASELMEAGRAIARGLVTKRTVLIASLHRVLAVAEKIAPGDGRREPDAVIAAAKEASGRLILADMEAAARDAGAPISAALFGALAASGALPIPRAAFEETIRASGRAVEQNLAAFANGAARAHGAAAPPPPRQAAGETEHGAVSNFPAQAHLIIREGHRRVVDFQDEAYGRFYLDRLERVRDLDARLGGERRDFALLKAAAKHLAVAMTYEDAIRIADLKTRPSRFERFRKDVRAAPGQIVQVSEYLHPRPEEICDILPAKLGERVLASHLARRALKLLLGEGRRVPTTKMRGFLPLFLMARLRFLRRGSYRYRKEQRRIDGWLVLIEGAGEDYAFACEIAALQRLIKGYGDTHDRSRRKYEKVVAALGDARREPEPARALKALIRAALADEEGIALDAAVRKLEAPAPTLAAAQ